MAVRENETWGTYDDYFLVKSVNWYRTNSRWDFIAQELREITSKDIYTSETCRWKFYELLKQFAVRDGKGRVVLQTLKDSLRDRHEKAEAAAAAAKLRDSVVAVMEPPKPDEQGGKMQSESALQRSPLTRILVLIRSQKNSSFFERRLPIQETNQYKMKIKRYMNLEIVEANLKEGIYMNSESSFFRDVLLIFTNAVVFYPNNSPEYMAARDIQSLVIKKGRRFLPQGDQCGSSNNGANKKGFASNDDITRMATRYLIRQRNQEESSEEEDDSDEDYTVNLKKAKKPRRPSKTKKEDPKGKDQETRTNGVKRSRGRPRKCSLPPPIDGVASINDEACSAVMKLQQIETTKVEKLGY